MNSPLINITLSSQWPLQMQFCTYPNLKMSFFKPIETEILNLHRKCKNEKKLKTLVSQKTLSAKTNVFGFHPTVRRLHHHRHYHRNFATTVLRVELEMA